VWRLRYLAVCVGLAALAFIQAPGMTVLDTKVDLTVDPLGWLAGALHLWDPSGSFGQIQNQAYGYLWPMGPFFVGGVWLGVPGWVLQRLWWALLMSVAFLGVVRLADRLVIGTPVSRLVAGVAFALSPRILTELGTISIEAWPTAVAPWVLVPLVGLARGASLRRSVALSALAVACAGGVNATAALAVVPLAVLWLAFLKPLRLRLTALAAWLAAVAAATLWWVVPLLILGRYSPPFLDYIESARATTRVTDLVTVTRGASHWLAYFGGPYGPALPAGYRLATELSLVIATIVVAGLGLAGLARPGIPYRRFLISGLLVGLALVGMGHVTAIDDGLAGTVRAFLDGVGAPLRNVHKFDVVLRLPLALGLAHLIGVLTVAAARRGKGLHPARARAAIVTATAVAAVLGAASPAFAGQLPTHGSYPGIPTYWYDAARWLDGHVGRNHVLVVPSARFPNYVWGRPSDEIVQALMRSSWAVRNDIPLAPPATIRLLDAIESTLATGVGSPGLADVLARSGVQYVLVRSDLDYGRSGSTRPIVVRQALARSPGLALAAAFGPTVGGAEDGRLVDSGLDVPVRALEVFEVKRPVDPVVATEASAVTTVVGGPESLLGLAASGQLAAAPTVLAGDVPGRPVGPVVLTDTMRRREVAFGLSKDSASATMEAGEAYQLDAPAHDYLPPWGESMQTVARYTGGVSAVAASNSWAEVEPLIGSRPEHLPFAAIDGRAETSWRTAPGTPVIGQWIEVTLAESTIVSEVRLTFDGEADFLPTEITVTAGVESVTTSLDGSAATVTLAGQHATRRVRVTVRDAMPVRFGSGGVGVTELEIPGVVAQRTLVPPPSPSSNQPATVMLTAAPSSASCVFADNLTRCAGGLRRASEDGGTIDRTLSLPVAGTYRASIWARPRPGPDLNALLDHEVEAATPLGLLPSVAASSAAFPDPAARPGAVLDGDPSTVWMPATGDRNPWLRLNWLTPRSVTGIRLTTAAGVAATEITEVTVVGDNGLRRGRLDDQGFVMFDSELVTDEITVILPETPPTASFEPYRNAFDLLPPAIGELRALPDPDNRPMGLDAAVALPCGSGPTLHVGTTDVRTAITATRRDLLQLREVAAQPCEGPAESVELGREARITIASSTLAEPTRVLLAPETAPTAASAATAPVGIKDWSATRRVLELPAHPADRLLAVRQNVNAGWIATVNGRELTPVVVDGWQQGWLLPAGASGEVVLRFAPDDFYRWALLAGVGTLGIVVLFAVIPGRRRGSHHYVHPTGPKRTRRSGRVLAAVVGGLALVSMGGLAAFVVLTIGTAAALAWHFVDTGTSERQRRRFGRAVSWWTPTLAFAVAAWLAVDAGDDRTAAGPQLAVIAAGCTLWLSTLLPARRLGQRRASR
jgi:arabinofuranan 3-O-arabinosyltransferase